MSDSAKVPGAKKVAAHAGLGKSAAKKFIKDTGTRDIPRIQIVAGLVTDGERIGLVRRSMAVASDPGLWHCVTGYLESGCSPEEQILAELYEELGLGLQQVVDLYRIPSLTIVQEESLWVVHIFLVATNETEFQLNWENDEFRWTRLNDRGVEIVPWLHDVLTAIRAQL